MPAKLGQICDLVGGELFGDPHCPIESAGPIDTAGMHQLTFAEHGLHLKRLDESLAAAIIVPQGVQCASKNLIQAANPRAAFAKALTILYPQHHPVSGVHATATIGENVMLGQDISLGAGVVIGGGVSLGDRVIVYPQVVVGDDVVIGDDTVIYPQVAIYEGCRIGRRVIIHAGTVIGSDGFGFVVDGSRQVKIPQVGIVQIDDDVEIGANNTIDRASFGKTWLKEGIKTDNQVHIAHNVEVGAHSVIAAQVAIAGSTTIGHHAVLAGQAGISGHLNLGNEIIVGPKAGVGKSIPDKQIMSSGIVAMPHATWLRLQKVLPQLPELFKQVRRLGQKVAEIEDGTKESTTTR